MERPRCAGRALRVVKLRILDPIHGFCNRLSVQFTRIRVRILFSRAPSGYDVRMNLPVLPQHGDDPIRGRGAAGNPRNRFAPLDVIVDDDAHEIASDDADAPRPQTQFLRDPTRTIIAHNDSPDVGFDASVNPDRGCEHGCIY
jgi:hypothetical protein